MIENILGYGFPGPIELFITLVIFAIPVLLIVLSIRFVVQSDKEKRRLRLEVGKLADELEQLKKQMNSETEQN